MDTPCERCDGLGEICRQGDATPGRDGRCWLNEKHGGHCEVIDCPRCGGLGYLGCSRCGERMSVEDWNNYGSHDTALCDSCECSATHGSATSGNDGIPAVAWDEPTEPGRVVAVDRRREWGDEPTLPEIQVPFSLLAWDPPVEPYQAPPAGKHDDENPTVEIPAIGDE